MPNGIVSWKIEGLRELDSRLRDLPTKLQSQALRQSVSAGGRVIRDDARSRVHNRKGDLRNAIRFTTSVKTSTGQAVAKLFVSVKKAWYGRLVEFGTLPHLIFGGKVARSRNYYTRRAVFGSPNIKANRFQLRTAPKRAQALNILGNFVEKVDHPGSAPHPFMQPAAEAKYMDAANAIGAYLRSWFEKAAR